MTANEHRLQGPLTGQTVYRYDRHTGPQPVDRRIPRRDLAALVERLVRERPGR